MLKTYAQRFLDEWLKSPPHRDNMVFADYDHAGVGGGEWRHGLCRGAVFDRPEAASAKTGKARQRDHHLEVPPQPPPRSPPTPCGGGARPRHAIGAAGAESGEVIHGRLSTAGPTFCA